MSDFFTWDKFVESKTSGSMTHPSQGKGTNPYMNLDPNGKLRVVKDPDNAKPLGEEGGSNITPADTSLGEPGGEGGVAVTHESKEKIKVNYPNGKVDGRIRVTKDKEKGHDWGKLRTPGMDPSVSSCGKDPEKGVGTTTEDSEKSNSMPKFSEYIEKKKM